MKRRFFAVPGDSCAENLGAAECGRRQRSRGGFLGALSAVVALNFAMTPSLASAITIDFDTEDDFVTQLINGQIVDPAFDGVDLEFGNLVSISSTQIGPGAHNGATIFDSDPTGPNSGSQDPDLLVDRGNILILQSNNPGSANDTSLDGTYGLVYDNPNDEADFNDRGSIVFDFIAPVVALSLEIVDANGGFLAEIILTDGSNLNRTFTVNSGFSEDINVCGVCNGYETLDLTNIGVQVGEGGGTASGVDDVGFDQFDVTRLEVKFLGNPSSGGIDTLVFVPEPSTGLLLALGLVGLGQSRRGARK